MEFKKLRVEIFLIRGWARLIRGWAMEFKKPSKNITV